MGPDGRAENTTTNPYVNALLHNGHQLEDMAYAIGAQESMMGANTGINPNLAYAQNFINPIMNNAAAAFNSNMNQPHGGAIGNQGHAAAGGQAPGASSGNPLWADVAAGAAMGAGYGAWIGWIPVVGQIGMATGAGIGAGGMALKHYLVG
jgi:hypothetical protein